MAPDAMSSSDIQPYRNAGSPPNDSRMYTYGPPACGSSAPSSAYVSAPAKPTSPPNAQIAMTQPAEGSAMAASDGVKKMPLPMIPPTTIMAAEKTPSSRRSSEYAAGEVVKRGSGRAGSPAASPSAFPLP